MKASELEIQLERDVFTRNLIRHLSGTLQDVIGLEEASGFISIVGRNIGEEINNTYKAAFSLNKLSKEQVADVLVDLKQRIQGNFSIESFDEEKIVFKTDSCPFGDKVIDRPSLCMMTSNVFGTIASENLGYAKISLEETIANHHPGCRVVVYLNQGETSEAVDGIEYYGQPE